MDARLRVAVGTAAAMAAVVFGLVTAFANAEVFGPEGRTAAEDLVELTLALAGATLVVAGGWWGWRRPTNRVALFLVLTGASLGLLQGLYWLDGWVGVGPVLSLVFLASGVGIRAFVYAAVLSWPNGRLRQGDVRLLWWFTGLSAGLTFLFTFAGADQIDAVLTVGEVVELARAAVNLNQFVVSPFMALVVLVVVQRRVGRLPASSRALFSAAVVSAGSMFVLDAVVLPVVSLGDLWVVDGSLSPVGVVASMLDWGRYALVGAACWMGASRYLRLAGAIDERRVDLDASRVPRSIVDALRVRTGDDRARVAYAGRSGWVEADGSPSSIGGDPSRTVTTLVRDGVVVAAVELDRRFDDQPALLEAAAGSVSAQLENERLQALALERLDEVRRARLAILDAEDAARRRLERDLHDGAQQRLVGLAIQTRLAAAQVPPPADEVHSIADGLAVARAELFHTADGAMPTVLAEQGLAGALTTLAVTTPLAVQIDVDLPEGVPPGPAAAVWYVVTEAIANAIKHAGAGTLCVSAGVVDGWLEVGVADDGVGGADLGRGSGLRGLRGRVEDLGGHFVVRPRPGGGTEVRASVPVAVDRIPALSGSAAVAVGGTR